MDISILTSLIELKKRMDVQKTMEFILEQQAAYAAYQQEQAGAIQDLRAATAELKALVAAHESDIQVHTEWLTGISSAMQRLTDQMQDGFVKTAAAVAAANAANKETRDNLNILVRTVQDIITLLPKQ